MNRNHRSIFRVMAGWACLMLLVFLGVANARGEESANAEQQAAMLSTLEAMARDEPAHADTWRLIGRIHHQRQRLADAESAYRRALYLQPNNVAAHFNLGELYEATGRKDAARAEFAQVVSLAPESNYTRQLVSRNAVVAPVVEPVFLAASHEESINTGPEPSPADIGTGIVAEPGRWGEPAGDNDQDVRLFIQTGALYSTNVGLVPISRELSPSQGSGFQGFLSPDIEWTLMRAGGLEAGTLFRGYYTLNESNFQPLDIASFQPGAFLKYDLPSWGVQDTTLRLDYTYALDLLGGTRFGDRHALTGSFTAMPTETDALFGYFSMSWADFTNDGLNPDTDSLDGPSYRAGLSRIHNTSWKFIPWTSFGADIERVEAEGADFRFHAISLHGSTTFQLAQRLQFITQTGIGYRHYGEFTGSYSRDELTLRAGARLQWQFSENYSVATVIDHNRFASINEAFDTERTEAGIVFTYQR